MRNSSILEGGRNLGQRGIEIQDEEGTCLPLVSEPSLILLSGWFWFPLTPADSISTNLCVVRHGRRFCAVSCPRHAASHGDPSRASRRIPQVISSHSSRRIRPGRRAILANVIDLPISTRLRTRTNHRSSIFDLGLQVKSGTDGRRRAREAARRERRFLLSPKSP